MHSNLEGGWESLHSSQPSASERAQATISRKPQPHRSIIGRRDLIVLSNPRLRYKSRARSIRQQSRWLLDLRFIGACIPIIGKVWVRSLKVSFPEPQMTDKILCSFEIMGYWIQGFSYISFKSSAIFRSWIDSTADISHSTRYLGRVFPTPTLDLLEFTK